MTASAEPSWSRRVHRLFFSSVALLPERSRAHARRLLFDGTHSRSADPWMVDSDPYQEEKRAALATAVGEAPASLVVEVGCSVGGNLRALADACPTARVIGVDVSREAVEIARSRVSGDDRIDVVWVRSLADLPSALPGPVDVLVLSEVLYYMGGDRGIRRELSPLASVLSPDARGVLVHSSSDAPDLHYSALDCLGLSVRRSSWVFPHSAPGDFLLTTSCTSSDALRRAQRLH